MQSIFYLNAIYNAKQLSNRLKLYREQQGWSQTEVANRIGVKQATISNFENHPDKTQLSTLFKIVQALGVSLHLDLPRTTESTTAANDEYVAEPKVEDDW